METAITLVSPPELTLAEGKKGQLSALVQIKLEETKTLTVVSTDEQFETAREQLRAIALLRDRIKGTLKPFIDFWHHGHKAHTTGSAGALDEARSGPVPERERGGPAPGGRAAAARSRRTAPKVGRRRSQAEGKRGCSRAAEA